MLIEGTKWEARRNCDSVGILSLKGEFACQDLSGATVVLGSKVGLVLLNEMTKVVLEVVIETKTSTGCFGWRSSGKVFSDGIGTMEGSTCFVFVREEMDRIDVTKKMLLEGMGMIEDALRRI